MNPIVVAVAIAIAAASCGSSTTTARSNDISLTCDTQRDEIVALLQSGLPISDYEPFRTTKALLRQSQIVVFGTVDSLTRDTSNEGWTIAAVSDTEIVHFRGQRDEVTTIAWSSWWADRSVDDPLADVVEVEGLDIVAFFASHEAAPGGLTPHIQGLAVSCAGSPDAPIGVEAPLPTDSSGLSLDELRTFVESLVEAETASIGEPLDGPLMRHPVKTGNFDGDAAEIFGVLQVEGECLYLAGDEPSQRFPVIWPAGTRWDAERQIVTMPNGDQIGLTDEAYGGGGYGYLDSVKTLLGRDAAALAERCVDNEFREIAIVNNHDDAIGRR